MNAITHTTRESWLKHAVELLRPFFEGLEIEDLKLAKDIEPIVSWPYRHKTAIGQCFPESWTVDKTTYITVSPVLGDDILRLLDVLVHELIHACGIHGHGKDFRKVALSLGLAGKMQATVASEGLKERLKPVAEALGPYPHRLMKEQGAGPRRAANGKSTRVRLVSPVEEDYFIEISRIRYERGDFPAPLCPFSERPLIEGGK